MRFTKPADLLAWLKQQQANGKQQARELPNDPIDLDVALSQLADPAIIAAIFDDLEPHLDAQGRLRKDRSSWTE